MSLKEKANVFPRNEELERYLKDEAGVDIVALKQAIFYLITTTEYQQREIEELQQRLKNRFGWIDTC